MCVSKAAEAALFACAKAAASPPDVPMSARDLAAACGVRKEYMTRILHQLVRSRILVSERGPLGGFNLRQRPQDVTLLAVVESVDGALTPGRDVPGLRGANTRVQAVVEVACRQSTLATRGALEHETLADLVR